jgi:hypothetical protein
MVVQNKTQSRIFLVNCQKDGASKGYSFLISSIQSELKVGISLA